MKKLFYLILLFIISKANGQQSSYLWPVGDGVTQIRINGVLNEYRNPAARYLHDGIDIHGSNFTTNVYPVADGTIDYVNETDLSVRITHTDASGTWSTWYKHIDPTNGLAQNQPVTTFEVIGIVQELNHVHLSEGANQNEVNPLQDGHLYNFNDFQNNNDNFPEFVTSGYPTTYTGHWTNGGITFMHNIGASIDDQGNSPTFTGYSANNNDEFIINDATKHVDIVIKARDQIFETDGASTPLSSQNLGLYWYWGEVWTADGFYLKGSFIGPAFNEWYNTPHYVFVANSNNEWTYVTTTEAHYYYNITNNATTDGYLNVGNSTNYPNGKYKVIVHILDIKGNEDTETVYFWVGNPPTGIGDDDEESPKEFKLIGNYPNPFNMETKIKFQLANQSLVTLKIYNTLGQAVKTIVNENKPAGEFAAIWDGRDMNNNIVSSGVYYYVIQATSSSNSGKNFVDRKKMILIK